MLRRAVEANPGCDGLILGGHGLFTWGDTQRECYLNSIRTIDEMGRVHRGAPNALGQAAVRRRGGHGGGARSRIGRRGDPSVSARRGLVEPARHRALRRLRRCADVCQLDVGGRSLPDGHELPGSLPAHAHLADVHPVEPRDARISTQVEQRIGERREQYREGLRGVLRVVRRHRPRRRCATRTRRWSSSPGSGCSGSARTSARRASRRSSSSTPST